jgi:hypothetical protein
VPCGSETSLHGTVKVLINAVGAITLTCVPAPSTTAAVKIDEVGQLLYGRFIELANATSDPVDLTNWKLVYRQANSHDDLVMVSFGDGAVIQAQGRLRIAPQLPIPIGYADFVYAGVTIDPDAGGLELRDAQGARVDSLAWGDAPNNGLGEGAPLPSISTSNSYGRYPDGNDSDSNAIDFCLMPPSYGAANQPCDG